ATLLLTLPGLPFVYYGEEIGMTGDKPDPRLRTPMQWSSVRGLGFTSGVPWERAQPDSLTTTVEQQQADPGSLLNLYRKLIHLRKSNQALALGRLLPLTASSPQVAAYLRREGDHAVLVVANLAGRPIPALSLSSADSVLPPGRYELPALLSGPAGSALEIGPDGRLRGYTPLAGLLGAGQSLVLELVRH
ncbi:MAG TPA: hypothetical protein VIP80_16505, partial [Gemmatimonadales bacterium]